MDDIKILRTLQGEEILGVVEKLSDAYKITNPVVLHWVANEKNPDTPKLVMAALMPHSDDTSVVITDAHIVFAFNPMQDIVNEYNSVYGSGIVVPTPKSVEPSGISTLDLA